MRLETIAQWMQIVTAVGVLVGVVLVLIELRQTRELTEAEIASENMIVSSSLDLAIIGEESAEVLARACHGRAMTDAQVQVFNAIQTVHLQNALRLYWIDLVAEFDQDSYQSAMRSELSDIMLTGAGRQWWEGARLEPTLPAPFVAMGDEVRDATSGPRCTELFEVSAPVR